MNTVTDVWSKVLEILKGQLTSTAINTWFDDCQAVDLRDSCLVLHTSSNFKKDVIESRFSPIIKQALYDLFNCEFSLQILGEGELADYQQLPEHSEDCPEFQSFTFGNFIVGSSNKFAHAAAMAVADHPAGAYNPLFIYGESGLGKTHLLYAIAQKIKQAHPDYKIVYIKGDDFTNELISAIQSGKNLEFRQKYRSADLFLVDDIQFIAGKVQTQEEFFHTFNTLYESSRQIVLTSDRPPMEILRLEDRLKTRFEWGLLADIQPPDYETRMAIINNKAQQLGLLIPEEAASYIAENITSNVRQIEGVVKKLTAYKDLLDDSVTVDSVNRAIKDMLREKTLPSPDVIIEETARYYSLSPEDLRGNRRTRNTALARQISMYLIRKLTTLTLKDIGSEFEGRDHSTVLNGIGRIEEQIENSQPFSQTVKDITANINARN